MGAKRGIAKSAGMDKDERAAAQKEAQKKLETKKEALRVQKIKDAEKEAADAKLKALFMLGFEGPHAVIAIQLGYCVSDIISKCGVGFLIYNITITKSMALNNSLLGK